MTKIWSALTTVLMRWAPGAKLPYHEHVAIEQTFVLEGSFADHDGGESEACPPQPDSRGTQPQHDGMQ